MSEDIDITDLLHLLEEHPLETIGTISRLAIREIKRLRAKIENLCQEIKDLESLVEDLDPIDPQGEKGATA